jgi:hypothetical protein
MKCVGCFKEITGVPTMLNDGNALCPTCTFIVAVYNENGIDKQFKQGDLMYHKISNTIRKAVDDFRINAKRAYQTYLPKMLKRMMGHEITDTEMTALIDESFPFIKLSIDDAERFELKVGNEFRCKSPDGRSVCRHIYAIRKFTGKESREHKYGRKAFVALFLPKEA